MGLEYNDTTSRTRHISITRRPMLTAADIGSFAGKLREAEMPPGAEIHATVEEQMLTGLYCDHTEQRPTPPPAMRAVARDA